MYDREAEKFKPHKNDFERMLNCVVANHSTAICTVISPGSLCQSRPIGKCFTWHVRFARKRWLRTARAWAITASPACAPLKSTSPPTTSRSRWAIAAVKSRLAASAKSERRFSGSMHANSSRCMRTRMLSRIWPWTDCMKRPCSW